MTSLLDRSQSGDSADGLKGDGEDGFGEMNKSGDVSGGVRIGRVDETEDDDEEGIGSNDGGEGFGDVGEEGRGARSLFRIVFVDSVLDVGLEIRRVPEDDAVPSSVQLSSVGESVLESLRRRLMRKRRRERTKERRTKGRRTYPMVFYTSNDTSLGVGRPSVPVRERIPLREDFSQIATDDSFDRRRCRIHTVVLRRVDHGGGDRGSIGDGDEVGVEGGGD